MPARSVPSMKHCVDSRTAIYIGKLIHWRTMRHLVTCSCTVLVLAGLLFPNGAIGQPWPTNGWRVSTPEKLKLRPGILAQLDDDIARGKYGNTNGMLIIRRGEVAYDRAYPHDYDRIYSEQARKPSSLNAHDFGGPYNYFNS